MDRLRSLFALSLVDVASTQDVFLSMQRMNSTGASLTAYKNNPILIATTAAEELQGQGNCYAPDVHYLGETSPKYIMWYGCQGGDGHDRIYWSWSDNVVDWRKFPDDNDPQPALDRGSSNHVNDPSVVRGGKGWMMYYTDASSTEDDKVWLAESSGYNGFSKSALVLDKGAAGSWESLKVGRPSVIVEDGTFKMWYDGQDGKVRSMGYATSKDGRTWTKHAGNPVLVGAGAADVKRVGSEYVMVYESHEGVHRATSTDGITWTDDADLYVPISGKDYDKYGTVTPFLLVKSSKVHSVWYAGCTVESWNKNVISAAFVGASPATGGCTTCNPEGVSCPETCSAASSGAKSGGTCANPGSTTSASCCGCQDDGCSTDCHLSCTKNGHDGGFCANGSCSCF